MRVGFGYDSHRLVEGRKLILGGVEVSFEKGLLGHSDADALLHAVGDAILGAAGERDIGCHFPDSDPAFKDISSRVLLERIFGIVRKNGFAVNNVDVTVVLEKPKLSPHIPAMRKTLESVLDLEADRISIKARTNEGMGFVGRGEGVAVFAVVSLKES
ncbi:MAG: 2-C-methyl-D-erythritol 2,4-cyclodiphosphate synthase [Syntrophobacterales bacterium]|jgi:2-C-methyl-D-erythritol 2,4-cyclodiphosphate synthase|nr:2-C-methyl-D-erythritol 2,4-cyclodiphosphate synthase [Syntrophobacterales bacterium]